MSKFHFDPTTLPLVHDHAGREGAAKEAIENILIAVNDKKEGDDAKICCCQNEVQKKKQKKRKKKDGQEDQEEVKELGRDSG